MRCVQGFAFSLIAAVPLVLVGCGGSQPTTSAQTTAGVSTQAESSPAETEDAQPTQANSQFSIEKVEAVTTPVMTGGVSCSAGYSACIQTGDTRFANNGSLYLHVMAQVKNTADGAESAELGELTARYNGKTYTYKPEEGSAESEEIQPLVTASLGGYYQVPVEVLNEANLAVDAAGVSSSIEFDRPKAQDERRAAAQAEADDQDKQKKLVQQKEDEVYEKCHGDKGDDQAPLSEEQYGWYIENCGSMYNVDDYQTYLKVRMARLSG